MHICTNGNVLLFKVELGEVRCTRKGNQELPCMMNTSIRTTCVGTLCTTDMHNTKEHFDLVLFERHLKCWAWRNTRNLPHPCQGTGSPRGISCWKCCISFLARYMVHVMRSNTNLRNMDHPRLAVSHIQTMTVDWCYCHTEVTLSVQWVQSVFLQKCK